uniref:tRNA nucleotidyltransferase/poly(A) polymerase n=1 Tax=Pithovirus LCPAC001 TaxID=2506585 RepID=A0A481Z1J9_9VIRU|nr:MAG: tRNA nucleotidyltransferase/poly(A) polymerase [Pithovirus LCPAC001]
MFKYLPNLFKDSTAEKLLSELNKEVLIAGGSVVYDQMAKKNNIDKSVINDVDLFMFKNPNNHEQIEKIINLISKYFVIEKISIGIGSYTENETSDEISVINIKLEEELVLFQLIITDCETPLQILNNFDMDYVQCGYYQNKLHITKCCVKSHTDSRIYKITPNVKASRLLKAATKGFKTVYFESDQNTKKITYKKIQIEQLKKLVLIPIIKNEEFVDVSTFKYYQHRQDFKTFKIKDEEIVISTYFFGIKSVDGIIIPKIKTIAIRCKVIDIIDDIFIKIDLLEYEKTTIWIDYNSKIKFKKNEMYTLIVRGVNSNSTDIMFKPLKIVKVVESGLLCNIKLDLMPPINSNELLKFLIKKYKKLECETTGKKKRALHIKYSAYEAFLYYKAKEYSEEEAIRKACIQYKYDLDKWFNTGVRPIKHYEYKYKKVKNVLEMIEKIELRFTEYTPAIKV